MRGRADFSCAHLGWARIAATGNARRENRREICTDEHPNDDRRRMRAGAGRMSGDELVRQGFPGVPVRMLDDVALRCVVLCPQLLRCAAREEDERGSRGG